MSDPSRAPAWLPGRKLANPGGLVFLALAGAALAYLVYEHRVHVLAFVPYLLLLACPLMHLFHHHGGHGGAHHGHREAPPSPDGGR